MNLTRAKRKESREKIAVFEMVDSMWVCKQHGKNCHSYVVGICEELNRAKIKTVGQAKKFYGKEFERLAKCVKWVKE